MNLSMKQKRLTDIENKPVVAKEWSGRLGLADEIPCDKR